MDILWEKSLQFIKEKLSQQNFETWIRPIKISSLEGNNIILNVPNKFFKDWLIENYQPVIKEALASVAGIDLRSIFRLPWKRRKAKVQAVAMETTRKKYALQKSPQDQASIIH